MFRYKCNFLRTSQLIFNKHTKQITNENYQLPYQCQQYSSVQKPVSTGSNTVACFEKQYMHNTYEL